jgi:Zn-dependent M28 family amino/carboxypeptidase
MRRTIGTSALLGALLLTLAVAAAPQSRGYGNAEAITQDELMVYDYFLASDQLEGRNVPSRGYDTAALFIASHLKEWGLKPIGKAEDTSAQPGENKDPLKPYLMPFELVSNQIDAANMKLTLTAPAPAGRGGRGGAGGGGGRGAAAAAGPRTFEYAREWTVGGGGFGGGGRGGPSVEPVDIAGAQLVFVGNGYVINKTNTDPYKGLDVRGKVVVVAGLPPELAAAQAAAAAGRGAAGAGRGRGGAPNPLGVENTDFTTPQTYAAKNGARAVIMVPTFQQLAAMSNPNPFGGRGAGPNGPPFQVVKFQAARAASVPVITAGVDLTNAIFQGEKLSGAQVFEGATVNAKLDSFDLTAEKKISLHTSVTSARAVTENVVGVIEGSDPVLKNEYVVFSGHLDHLGLSNPDATGDRVFNGADDDASGSSALMAMAHAYATGAAKGMRPKRTIIFAWVAGEEKGLWGSQYFNQFPPIDITKVVADLNMDMIGRTKNKPGYVDPPSDKLVDPGEVFVVGPNISSDELEKTLETVNNGYQKLKLNHFYDVTAPDATHDNLGPGAQGQRIFYRSDHYNFAKMGIPIAFFTTGIHVDYHRLTDSPEKIDFVTMHRITKTVAATGWVLANSPTKPKLNAKLPEQLINDMKAVQAQGWGKLTPIITPPTTPY